MDNVISAPIRRRKHRAIFSMASANFDSWLHTPRTVVMLLFVIGICYTSVSAVNQSLIRNGIALFWGEKIFYHLFDGCNMKMTSMMFLIMASELPRRISFQNYALLRSSRIRWLTSQMLYCVWMVLFMLLLVALCTTIFSIGAVTQGSGWSDTARIAEGTLLESDSIIPQYIREGFTPFTASLMALLPLFLFWFTMLLCIMLFSLFGLPLGGVLFYGVVITADVLISWGVFFPWVPLPLSFSTLWHITQKSQQQGLQNYWKVIAGYFVVIAILLGVSYLRVKRNDITIYSENHL